MDMSSDVAEVALLGAKRERLEPDIDSVSLMLSSASYMVMVVERD